MEKREMLAKPAEALGQSCNECFHLVRPWVKSSEEPTQR